MTGNNRPAADLWSNRAAGWLRFLQRKTSLPGDDWSHRGRPAPAWDNISGPPTTNWYRFDAIGMAHTLLMLATASETHRRACADILEGLCERLALHHGFNEWVEQQTAASADHPTRAKSPNSNAASWLTAA